MPDRRKRTVTRPGERPLADLPPESTSAGAKKEGTGRRAKKPRGIEGASDASPDHEINIGPRGSADTW